MLSWVRKVPKFLGLHLVPVLENFLPPTRYSCIPIMYRKAILCINIYYTTIKILVSLEITTFENFISIRIQKFQSYRQGHLRQNRLVGQCWWIKLSDWPNIYTVILTCLNFSFRHLNFGWYLWTPKLFQKCTT